MLRTLLNAATSKASDVLKHPGVTGGFGAALMIFPSSESRIDQTNFVIVGGVLSLGSVIAWTSDTVSRAHPEWTGTLPEAAEFWIGAALATTICMLREPDPIPRFALASIAFTFAAASVLLIARRGSRRTAS